MATAGLDVEVAGWQRPGAPRARLGSQGLGSRGPGRQSRLRFMRRLPWPCRFQGIPGVWGLDDGMPRWPEGLKRHHGTWLTNFELAAWGSVATARLDTERLTKPPRPRQTLEQKLRKKMTSFRISTDIGLQKLIVVCISSYQVWMHCFICCGVENGATPLI